MKKTSTEFKAILGLSLIATIAFINIRSTYAETISSNSDTATNSKIQVEVSLPIQRDDFLLFYGITNNANTDAKILELRKDFTKKFDALKDEYTKSFTEIVGDQTLSPVVSLDKQDSEIKTAPQTASLRAVKIDTAKVVDAKPLTKASPASENKSENTEPANTDQKYILTNIKDGIITPLVNIISDSPTIKIESSSWFQKIKSWFGW